MFRYFSGFEKLLSIGLMVLIVVTSVYLYRRFIRDNSVLIAVDGGIFTEGLVGRAQFLNPVLNFGNAVDADISQLIFSGLTRYNPHTGQIEDDLATSEKSRDNRIYTFTIVPDAMWHDGVPVTADDVIFTYEKVLKSASFPNGYLKQSFSDVQLKKIDERTVQFQLKEPYSFFLANVTIGLLPEHYLGSLPVENLTLSEFNQQPIGTGPYQFKSWAVTNETNEIILLRNDGYYGSLPKIQTLIFRVFPSLDALLLAVNTLKGFHLSSQEEPQKLLSKNSRFEYLNYSLPQYTALFLNMDADNLANKKVRFALLLATDKDKILDLVGAGKVVDTPILESKADLDIEFSLERARGAFFDTEWNLPEKLNARVEMANKEGKDLPTGQAGLPTGLPSEEGQAGDKEIVENDKSLNDTGELLFKIVALQDSWLSISVDKGGIQSFLLSAGQERSYTVQDKLVFNTIGNAAGVAVSVNGFDFEPFGAPGEVIRSLVLNREYISEHTIVSEEPVVSDMSAEPPDQVDLEPEVSSLISEPDPNHEPIEPVVADSDQGLEKVRINDRGERLVLRLITVQEPPIFLEVAEMIQKQWLEAGAKVIVETYPLMGKGDEVDIQDKIQSRDYDILLFGQNLGYNHDAFPFWHSSQADTGLNLSNYRSLVVDNLLVDIRKTFDERSKQELLDKLKKVIAEETPAVFLYDPDHYYVVDKSVNNVDLGSLSSHADRFTDLSSWYIKEDYELNEEFGIGMLVRWLFSW